MKIPVLQKNYHVEIIAPGYGGTLEEIEKAAAYVASLGLAPHFPQDIFSPDLFCSNSDEYRAAHLIDALTNPETKAIWALRGGYGTTRIIEFLKKIKPPKIPKLVIGYSDITALHIFLNQEWGWPTLHAPVLAKIEERITSESRAELQKIIFGEKNEVVFASLTPLNIAANRIGEIESSVTGGNMVLVQSSLGTDWQIETKGKILFLEEFGEKAYRVDRIMVQLAQAGIFAKAKAVIFGQFIETESQSIIDKTVTRFARELAIPALSCDKIGHGETNFPLPLGTKARLSFGENISLAVTA